MVEVSRFEVWLVELNSVELNPTQGSEINKRRPCMVISPNELLLLNTVIVAPMTTKGFKIDCRVGVDFKGKSGLIVLDQIRTIDKTRLIKKLGCVDDSTQIELCNCLQEMFAL